MDIINKNAFVFPLDYQLPISYLNKRNRYSKDIPIIGSFLNLFGLGGFDISKTINSKSSQVCGFVNAELFKMFIQISSTLPTGRLDKGASLNCFAGEDKTIGLFGAQSCSTTICQRLSDTFDYDTTATVKQHFTTEYLGQEYYENGTPIFPDPSEPSKPLKPVLYNTNSRVVKFDPTEKKGFIIDYFMVQALFKGKMRISFYVENQFTKALQEV
jgi:hypothetical protein